jgi:hypothetical protein
MTEGLPAAQPQASASAPVQLKMAAPAPTADPFAVHLDAPVQKKGVDGANAAEPKWVQRAREYHQDNPKWGQQFKEATNNACVGADGELDPNEIARWQVKHGVKPDGICGPDTAAAAIALAHGDECDHGPSEAPAKVDENAPLPPAAPKQDPGEALNTIKQVGGGVVNAAGSVWDSLVDIFTGGNDAGGNAAGGNAKPKAAGGGGKADEPTPTPTPAPSQEPKDTPAPKHGPIDQGEIGDLSDATLRDLAMKSNDPAVKEIAADLAGLVEASEKMRAKITKYDHEEKGSARDKFVANIGEVRKKLAALKGEAAFKAAAFRLIASIGPYYSQSRNIDILESPPPEDTRTCNITSLAMALEGIGRSAASFTGSKEKVQAAAKFYSHKITGDEKSKAGAVDAVNGQGVSWSQLVGMRLSDFLELAAIARSMPDTSDDGVKAGAKSAWNTILNIGVLEELGQQFGASGSVKRFDATGIKHVDANKKKGIAAVDNDAEVLGDFSHGHRKNIEKYINAKNKGQDLSKLQAGYDAAMNDTSIDERLSLETYRDYVIEHIGADLEKGGSIVISLSGHYAKLQAIVADGIIVADPARDSRSATHLSWKEARAMGYFKHRLVLS